MKVKGYAIKPFIAVLFLFSSLSAAPAVTADDGRDEARELSIEEFVELASANDTVFDEILIDELELRYKRTLALPAEDLILSVKAQYDLFLGQSRSEPDLTLSLSKLFPFRGTEVSLTYARTPSISSPVTSSSLAFLISQPIARNAFGRSTKITDKIKGIEIDVVRYQIIEAYEDYLAVLLATYYNWYSAYENLMIGRESYKENLRLLDNINKRRKQKIALPVDVNKVKLLVIGKRESVIVLEESYNNLANLIGKAIRHDFSAPLFPRAPSAYQAKEIDFENDYADFKTGSRTYAVLKLLEEKSSLEVESAADDLLPSTNLLLGYKVAGEDWEIGNNDKMAYVGLSVEWPLPGKVEKAEHELSLIGKRRTRLSSRNKYLQIETDLKNLDIAIEREKRLLAIAEEKIKLAGDILIEEAENYSFGKVTLNDYISAVNRLDENRFNKITHIVRLNKFLVEWLRLTDRLVDKSVLGQINERDE